MDKPIAININFDSLNENLGFPKGYKDPSYFEVFDRFLKFSTYHNFKYSIYLIGKDLENPEINARVKDWSQMGHEIGNHSHTHCLNLGRLKQQEIQDEILYAHEAIHNCTGIEPTGFICPGWSTSKKVLKVLIDNNYLYDASIFPSPIIYPAVMKNAFNHLSRPKKFIEIISRKDYSFPFSKPISPFISDSNYRETTLSNEKKIIVFPLPTIKRFSLSFWHTLFFVLSKEKVFKRLDTFLNQHPYFYYLLHPMDLIDQKDFQINYNYTVERKKIDVKTKEALLAEVFERIHDSKRPIVTMHQLALNFLKEKESTNSIS